VRSGKLIIADDSLENYFDETTFWRGVKYAESDRVLSAEWDPRLRQLDGLVRGSGQRQYVTSVQFGGGHAGVLELASCTCSCPVGIDCKHAAALVLATGMPASIAVPEPSRWVQELGALLPEADHLEPIGLGIQLSVTQPRAGDPVTPTVHLRPVAEGATGWVAGSLNWANLAWQLREGRRFDPRHAAILGEIFALYSSSRGRHYGNDTKIPLSSFDSPRLWPLLDAARSAGVRFVQGRTAHDDVIAAAPARYCVDMVQDTDSGELTVQPLVRLDDESSVLVAFIGTDAHGVVYADAADLAREPRWEKCRLRLAPLDTTIPAAAQRMVLEQRRLVVPATDRPQFLADYLPRLRRTAAVLSSDESFSPPAISGPELVLTATSRPDSGVDVRRQWVYLVDGREYRSDPIAPAAGHRDPSAEQQLLAELTARLEPCGLAVVAQSSGPVRLTAMESLAFVTELVPLLTGLPGIRVEFEGPRPEFRDVGDALVIEVSATESGSDTDWFNLGITVSVDGRAVPFLDLFHALCADQSHVMLPGGAYFSLQKPQLQSLRRLIEEARALTDAAPDALRISRFQAGLWEQLIELGVVGKQAASWRRQVQGLLDLESLEPPAPPADLAAELRPYQLDGFAWLAFLWQHRLGGILADDMGLGKTVQTLALICHARRRRRRDDPWLIVAPASVVANWAAESARFAPGLRVATVTDTFGRSGRVIDDVASGIDILVVSYTLLRLDVEEYTSRRWSGLVLDEAQFVKNHQSKIYQCVRRVDTGFTLAVTGTPMENNVMELWALLSITAPGLFPHPARFRDYYAKPIEKGDAELLAQLRRRIKPLLRRRTKEQVAADLPEKQEQLLEVELAPKHRKLYDTRLQRERQKVLGLIEDMNRNRFTILRSLTLLRQLSLHAALVDEKHHAVASAKIEALAEQLHDVVDGGHRALVFSQFTGFLAHVRARLDAEGIEYCYLDGKTRNRSAVVERFRTGTAPIFLISLKAGGFGMNLTEADYCFLLDPWWNPATEAQAVDRTHRIGQTRNVMVYRLIAKDTIEEKVMQLKTRKSQLFDGVLDDGGEFGGALEADDIRALLE
jgi:superfamily II DNA or RNA helicase